MALDVVYAAKAALASLPYATRAIIVTNIVCYLLLKIVPSFNDFFCLQPQKLFFDGHGHRLLLYSLIHADIWHLVLNCVAFCLTAPHVEGSIGSARFLFLIFLLSIVTGVCYSALMVCVTAMASDKLYGWSGCAIGFSGNVLALLIIWAYNFAAKINFKVTSRFQVPMIAIPAVLLIVSLWLPSPRASLTCHVMGLFVGFCFAHGALERTMLSSALLDRIMPFVPGFLLANRQGFVSHNVEQEWITLDAKTAGVESV